MRTALLDEGGHAFCLVVKREVSLEQLPLDRETLFQRGFERAVDQVFQVARYRLRVSGDLGGGFERDIEVLVERHNARDQAGALGLVDIHHAPRQTQVHRFRFTDQRGQALGAADAGHDTELDFRLAEPGVVGGDDEIAHHRQLATAAERITRDRGDDRLCALRDAIAVPRQAGIVEHLRVGHILHFADIGAGREGLVAAADDDRADTRIGLDVIERDR